MILSNREGTDNSLNCFDHVIYMPQKNKYKNIAKLETHIDYNLYLQKVQEQLKSHTIIKKSHGNQKPSPLQKSNQQCT